MRGLAVVLCSSWPIALLPHCLKQQSKFVMGTGVACSSGGMDGWLGWMRGKASRDRVRTILCSVKPPKAKYIVAARTEG